jgi:omega-amidase
LYLDECNGGFSMKIGLVQFDIAWEDKKANFDFLETVLFQNDTDYDLIVLPEMFSTGFSMNARFLAEDMTGPSIEWMLHMSKKRDSAICGSLIVLNNSYCTNRLIWVEPTGKIRYYDKRHLFSPGGEDLYYKPGKEHKVFGYEGWRFCPQICYDLRFPEWQRVALPFDALVFVASWPSRRIDAWVHLLKSRAIENQCYVVGVNRVGVDGNQLEYTGQSMVFAPDGSLVLDAKSDVGLFTADLSIDFLNEYREKFPFLKDRSRITFD